MKLVRLIPFVGQNSKIRNRSTTRSFLSELGLLVIVVVSLCTLVTANCEAETAKPAIDAKNVKPAVARSSVAHSKTVLALSRVHGRIAGYVAAKACPEVIDKLFCYCGCDLGESHNTLLDCFISDHGAYCDDCQEEAILAQRLHKDGVSMKEIQETVDKKFSKHYPFTKHSPRYQKYLDSRLYKDGRASSAVKTVRQTSGSKALNAAPFSTNAKLKPGKTIGKCCAGSQQGVKAKTN
jgi:hypothetical protein